MDRRLASLAIPTLISATATPAAAALPLLLRILLGTGIRGTANVAAQGMARSAVTMSVRRGAMTASMQVVTTKQIGITITGVLALSVPAAEIVAQHDVKAICVRGIDKYATVVADNFMVNSTQLVVNVYNSVNNSLENSIPLYANVGKKEFEFDLPWETGRHVRRFEGSAKTDRTVRPFSSGNVLFTSTEDVVYER